MPLDRIRLNEMVFYGYHGVLPEERALGQRFVVDVELRADLAAAAASDDLAQTVNYAEAYATVRDLVAGPPCNLIEALAERIASRLLAEQPLVQSVSVRVRKPEAPIPGSVLGSSEVWIERDRSPAHPFDSAQDRPEPFDKLRTASDEGERAHGSTSSP